MFKTNRKGTLQVLGLNVFTNNLKTQIKLYYRSGPSRYTKRDHPLPYKTRTFIRESLTVCKGAFLFSMGQYSSNKQCSHTKLPRRLLLWTMLTLSSLVAPFSTFPFPRKQNSPTPKAIGSSFLIQDIHLIHTLISWICLHLDYFGYAAQMQKSFGNQNPIKI